MRLIGVVDSARGLVPGAHLCWAYADRGEYDARAAEWLQDGLEHGQFISFVGSGTAEQLADRLCSLPGGERALAARRAEVRPVEQFYLMERPGVVDPVASVEARVAAGKEAVASGHSGFRAIVDATSVALTPEGRAAFARFEHLIDVEMSRLPISALCAYDTRQVDRATVSHLAALHPLTSPRTAACRVCADTDADLALVGEADGASTGPTLQALRTVLSVLDDDDELRVRGEQLAFVDHRCLLQLDGLLADAGRTATLQGASSTVTSLATLLPLRALSVEGGRRS